MFAALTFNAVQSSLKTDATAIMNDIMSLEMHVHIGGAILDFLIDQNQICKIPAEYGFLDFENIWRDTRIRL